MRLSSAGNSMIDVYMEQLVGREWAGKTELLAENLP
jgi:hypothetical protein